MAVLTGSGKKLRDFQIQVPLLDQSNNPIGRHNMVTLAPRYTDNSTALTKTFSASGDYADASNHNNLSTGWSYDLKVDWHSSGAAWYNYTYDTNSGRRGSSGSPSNGTSLNDYGNYISLYLDIAIGDGPHPGVGTNYAHMAILNDGNGAHHQYQFSGATVDWTQARTFPDFGFHNVKVSGQNYGAHNYRQWFCWADMQSWSNSNVNTLRFINWGGGVAAKSRIQIAGAALIIHGLAGANSGADN